MLLATLGCPACSTDPVHDAEVAALGPEAPGIPKGPYHRAGQPCGVCHSSEGPAHTTFTLAGTAFSSPYPSRVGVGGVVVNIEDEGGNICQAITNCVGNFYVEASSSIDPCAPAFPVWVGLAPSLGAANTQAMMGHIGRDSSCASCHSDPPGPTSPGHVTAGLTADAGACAYNPDLSPGGG